MIKYFLIKLLVIIALTSWGQNSTNYVENCYKIQFILKDSIPPDSIIIPVYQEHGFEIIENGVYDFVIDRKKYFQALILDIDSSSFSISENWSFVNGKKVAPDTVTFTSTQDIKIRMVTINNGIGGLPFKASSKDYDILFIKDDKYCKMENAIINDGQEFDGLYYFTGYGWKKIKMIEGKPYLCEPNGQYRMRRK